jgi:hypothetical protein
MHDKEHTSTGKITSAILVIEEQLQPKRAHTDDDAGYAHEKLAEIENWDLRDHRQVMEKVRGMASESWQNQRLRSTSCTTRSTHRQEQSPRQF